MKVRLSITDDNGRVFEGEVDVLESGRSHRSNKSTRRTPTKTPVTTESSASVNFNLPVRAFIKRYAKGQAGAEKFTLLLAHMTKGKTHAEVTLKDLTKLWGKMQGFLGKFNGAHSTRARDNGWVDSPKFGTYILLQDWKQMF